MTGFAQLCEWLRIEQLYRKQRRLESRFTLLDEEITMMELWLFQQCHKLPVSHVRGYPPLEQIRRRFITRRNNRVLNRIIREFREIERQGDPVYLQMMEYQILDFAANAFPFYDL